MLSLEITANVAVVVMARPPVNAFDQGFVAAWNGVLDEVERVGAGVLHIRSAQKVFSAGADLKMMREFFSGADASAKLVAHVETMQVLFNRVEAMNCISIAEIGGSALGGGLEFALACDLRVASHDAALGLPEALIGLIPGAGGTQRIARLCGNAAAKRIILAGEMLNGTEAERLGLVHWAVPKEELAGCVRGVIGRVAAASPAALAAGKRCMAQAAMPMQEGLAAELRETQGLLDSTDTRGRIQAFLDSRKAA